MTNLRASKAFAMAFLTLSFLVGWSNLVGGASGHVTLWTDKSDYQLGEVIRFYIDACHYAPRSQGLGLGIVSNSNRSDDRFAFLKFTRDFCYTEVTTQEDCAPLTGSCVRALDHPGSYSAFVYDVSVSGYGIYIASNTVSFRVSPRPIPEFSHTSVGALIGVIAILIAVVTLKRSRTIDRSGHDGKRSP